MFLKKKTDNYIKDILKMINEADGIVVGAGAGLSTAAGYEYGGKRFKRYFNDFEDKYGIHDMYSGGFYSFETLEEYWAWWSRHIYYNRYVDHLDLYKQLLSLVEDKDYFVITTNVDHCFIKAGFDKQRIFYTQGDYGLFQCSEPCHQETYDNKEIIETMVYQQNNMKIPSSLIPYCPHCGKPMTVNLRCDDTFVEDYGWHQAKDRYLEFLKRHQGLKIVYLELGVGQNTPGIIKYPFWKMVDKNKNASYVCINTYAYCPPSIEKRSICISEDIKDVLDCFLNKEYCYKMM